MAKELDGDAEKIPKLKKAWPVPLGRLSPALARALEMPAEFSEWPEGKLGD